MRPVLNTLLFTVFVPGTVAGLIPWLLRAGRVAHPTRFDLVLGALAIVFGLAIYLHTAFWGFALHGRGTPPSLLPKGWSLKDSIATSATRCISESC